MRPIITALCLALACAVTAASKPAPFTLETIGECTFLKHGNKRFVLRVGKGDLMRYTATARGDGTLLVTSPGRTRTSAEPETIYLVDPAKKTVRKLPVRDVIEAWLQDEPLWGGHASANQMQYMHRGGGGIGAFFGGLVPRKDSALALMNWYCKGPSLMPVCAVFLVRISTQPALAVTRVKAIDLKYNKVYAASPPLLLQSDRGLLYLHTIPPADDTPSDPYDPYSNRRELCEMSAGGIRGTVLATFAGSLQPCGLLDRRWLILHDADPGAKRPIQVFDIVTRKLATLPGPWGGEDSFTVDVPPDGHALLISRTGRGRTSHYVVRLPGGQRAVHSGTYGANAFLWQGAVITTAYQQPVQIYDAATWRKLAPLRLP